MSKILIFLNHIKKCNISLYFAVLWKFPIMQDTSSLTVSNLYLPESTFAEDSNEEKSYASYQVIFPFGV